MKRKIPAGAAGARGPGERWGWSGYWVLEGRPRQTRRRARLSERRNRMKRRVSTGTALGAAAVVLLAAIAIAQFWGLQTSSGTVSAAVVEQGGIIYICDGQTGTGVVVTLPGGASVRGCNSDDSGADEAIFESDERLVPGGSQQWDIILWNSSAFPWDIPDFDRDYGGAVGTPVDVQVTEATDPGGDCPDAVQPRIDASISNYIRGSDGTSFASDTFGHLPPDGGAAPEIVPSDGYVREGTNSNTIPHVPPLFGARMRLRAILDRDVPNACQGNEWAVSIAWSVVSDPD